MLTFTQDSTTYTGFARLVHPPQAGTTVVVAWFDGEPELWSVEHDNGFAALRKYYDDEWTPGRTQFTRLFVR